MHEIENVSTISIYCPGLLNTDPNIASCIVLELIKTFSSFWLISFNSCTEHSWLFWATTIGAPLPSDDAFSRGAEWTKVWRCNTHKIVRPGRNQLFEIVTILMLCISFAVFSVDYLQHRSKIATNQVVLLYIVSRKCRWGGPKGSSPESLLATDTIFTETYRLTWN